MKRIGVVVPVYNTEPFLEKCINSIMKQSYKNIEIMLVDDGSTDNSGMICEKYARFDKRIHIIHEENMGPIIARYKGVLGLDCDYITFVDSDDWIDSGTYNLMTEYMDDDYDIIVFQIIRYFDERNQAYSEVNTPIGKYDKNGIENIILPKMIWDINKNDFGLDPSLCNKLIKRDKLLSEFEKIKEMKIHYGEDMAIVYPIIQNIDSLVISDQYLYYHRQRQEGKIAPYISDDSYYENLFSLYHYLKKCMRKYSEICKQLDYFYIHSVGMRSRIYGDRKSRRGYVFPFDIIPAKSRIIIYGSSEVGQLFYEQVHRIDYCTIVVWVDRNYLSYRELGVKPIDAINEIDEYDYIVIAIGKKDIAKRVISDLVLMGVNEKKIVWSVR